LKIPARRRINREQEVLELNSKLPVQMRENEKEKLEVTIWAWFLPLAGNVKNKGLPPFKL
jgi:hypothetical protein